MSNKQIIRQFIELWSTLDADKLTEFFTEDGTYHNIPASAVSGRDNVKEFIKGFTANWTGTNWEVISIVEDNDIVVAERIDHIDMGDKHADLPCVGVFEMSGGKIRVWRDYFDLNTYMKALQ
ncbi:MAG TPA: limonene-1,2-epoxide hydrolase family protein [Pseudomonadales bacterium]|nr:limonene-1,2-epoxide hydrolase family protein [Pseudomonadales bacterium]